MLDLHCRNWTQHGLSSLKWRWVLSAVIFLALLPASTLPVNAKQITQCDPLGWFPTDFGLKDHSIFRYKGYYYLVSIHVPNNHIFAYARSTDLCIWEELAPVSVQESPAKGAWDEMAVWAPSVYEEKGTYYMFYTGVTKDFTQSIMLAVSDNPDDPSSWQPQGMVFQPTHPNSAWKKDQYADCRDPMVLKVGNQYYLYYTGTATDGRILGMATSTSLFGPWKDWGDILSNPMDGGLIESPTVYEDHGVFYLFYHDTHQGEQFRTGASPAGPWSRPSRFSPGWAHEVWEGKNGQLFTSYLTDYTVSISPLVWDTYFDPPRPAVDAVPIHYHLPLILLDEP